MPSSTPSYKYKKVTSGRISHLQLINHGSSRTRRVFVASFVEKHVGSFRGVQYDDWIPEFINVNDIALISLGQCTSDN